jgi:hypothetical protein
LTLTSAPRETVGLACAEHAVGKKLDDSLGILVGGLRLGALPFRFGAGAGLTNQRQAGGDDARQECDQHQPCR